MMIAGWRGLFEHPSTIRQVVTASVLGTHEIMFAAYGSHSAIVHSISTSSAPFIVDLEW